MIIMTLDKRFKIETPHGVYIFDIGDKIYFTIDKTKQWMNVFKFQDEVSLTIYVPEFLRARTKRFIKQFWKEVEK